MKRHLKSLFLLTLTGIPIVSVAACASSPGFVKTPEDILNSAEGWMKDHKFNMSDLNLEALPENNKNYDEWTDTAAKEKINEYYSDLVKEGNPNWEYETVKVTVRAATVAEGESFFSAKYGNQVEARVNLIAELKFKDLAPRRMPIVVRINNDDPAATKQVKIDAVTNYVKDFLNNHQDLPFKFSTLFKNELASKEVESSNLLTIIGALKNTLKNSVPDYPGLSTPIIDLDYIDIDVFVTDPTSTETIYDLETVTPKPDDELAKGSINGVLKNLTIKLYYSDASGASSSINLADLTAKQLVTTQTFTEAESQIYNLLDLPEDALTFYASEIVGGKVPASDSVSLGDYDSYNGGNPPATGFTAKVQAKIFDIIETIYPHEIMGSDWSSTIIKVVNPETLFVHESDGSQVQYGYFLVDLQINVVFGNDERSNILVNYVGLKITLSELGPSFYSNTK